MTTRPLLDGSTVLVTGASAGIGHALVIQIAPRAAELVLVGRRIDRLTALADQLRTEQASARVVE